MLLKGHYNGIFEPDRHYIAVDNDLGNIGEALLRFRDAGYREQMAEETYKYVMDRHTYAHRLADLVKVVSPTARA